MIEREDMRWAIGSWKGFESSKPEIERFEEMREWLEISPGAYQELSDFVGHDFPPGYDGEPLPEIIVQIFKTAAFAGMVIGLEAKDRAAEREGH